MTRWLLYFCIMFINIRCIKNEKINYIIIEPSTEEIQKKCFESFPRDTTFYTNGSFLNRDFLLSIYYVDNFYVYKPKFKFINDTLEIHIRKEDKSIFSLMWMDSEETAKVKTMKFLYKGKKSIKVIKTLVDVYLYSYVERSL